jgi:DMSO/TMAO reductase YedYZ molybdopterin-dependent catalytic subunit
MNRSLRSRRRSLTLALSIAGLAALTVAAAPPPTASTPSIEIAGALPRTGTIALAELKKLKVVKAPWKSHGEPHEVTGVFLDQVLAKFGFEPGVMGKEVTAREKRRGWRKAIVASAKDVFSCAELFEDMGATRALLVWEVDGKPLPADRGPFRLVVLTDKEPSRSVHGVARIEVVDLADRVP